MKPKKLKLFLLLIAIFVLGASTSVVLYAHGSEVLENAHILMVSHTEYRYNEPGQIIVRLVNYLGNPISVDNCTANILYPNKTYFVQDALMSSSSFSGDHYYNFTTPNGPEGVYEYQAVCTWNSGTKVKRATNSFHLSSAFNTILSDLDSINTTVVSFRSEVQDNFSSVFDYLADINTSCVGDACNLTQINITINQINSTVNAINSSLNSFITDTQQRLSYINTTNIAINNTVNQISTDLSALNSTVNTRFDAVESILSGNFSEILANLSSLRQLILDINSSLSSELSNIHTDLLSINTSIINKIEAVNLSITSDISSFRAEVAANFSLMDDWLNYINATTVDTYSYVTGTLTSKIDSILTQIGVINATVNRIEQNTVDINSTVNQIKQNQEDEVFMNVFSG